jgi:hypothetical protein
MRKVVRKAYFFLDAAPDGWQYLSCFQVVVSFSGGPAVMNREEWLNLVAEQMAPWFETQGHKLPRYRVAIGFPSTGKRGKRIGECWDGRASADGTFEVLIRPDQSDPIAVAAILACQFASKRGSDSISVQVMRLVIQRRSVLRGEDRVSRDHTSGVSRA